MEQFQKLSAAKDILLKHLEASPKNKYFSEMELSNLLDSTTYPTEWPEGTDYDDLENN